tara:strand:- start:11737 stop:12198 length:462 start_codon:yes stop_codon:yes gene_type:complete
MEEVQRIKSLFDKIYRGPNWIEVDIISVLSKLSAQQAAKRILPKSNSIWEIVVHMVRWRENVLLRVQGTEIATPVTNYIETVERPTEAEWVLVLQDMERSQEKWLGYLSSVKVEAFDKRYRPNNMDHYDHIMGILQHDAYHLGQIAMQVKYTL